MQAGTRIVLLPGNHDDNLRSYLGLALGRFEVLHEAVHETLRGARYLVVHGDGHDKVVMRLAKLSRVACRWKERLAPRTRLFAQPKAAAPDRKGLWATIKRHAGNANDIETGLASDAARRGLDGVICGHTHMPADRQIAGVHYLNCGDWMGSSTAVGESWTGRLALLRWDDVGREPAPVRALANGLARDVSQPQLARVAS